MFRIAAKSLIARSFRLTYRSLIALSSQEMYETYIKYSMNPFYEIGAPIKDASFEQKATLYGRKYLV